MQTPESRGFSEKGYIEGRSGYVGSSVNSRRKADLGNPKTQAMRPGKREEMIAMQDTSAV